MEKIARQFRSHRESDEADRAYNRSLTPQQRLEILLDLIAQAQGHETQPGFARVYRIVKLHER